MTEGKIDSNQRKSVRIARFISSLPFWWLALKGLQAAFLPSKNPDMFELYSYKKAIALVGIIIFCMIYLKFVQQKLSHYISSKFSNTVFTPRPVAVFLTLNLIVASTSYFQGVSVGEDIAGQVKVRFSTKAVKLMHQIFYQNLTRMTSLMKFLCGVYAPQAQVGFL